MMLMSRENLKTSGNSIPFHKIVGKVFSQRKSKYYLKSMAEIWLIPCTITVVCWRIEVGKYEPAKTLNIKAGSQRSSIFIRQHHLIGMKEDEVFSIQGTQRHIVQLRKRITIYQNRKSCFFNRDEGCWLWTWRERWEQQLQWHWQGTRLFNTRLSECASQRKFNIHTAS